MEILSRNKDFQDIKSGLGGRGSRGREKRVQIAMIIRLLFDRVLKEYFFVLVPDHIHRENNELFFELALVC